MLPKSELLAGKHTRTPSRSTSEEVCLQLSLSSTQLTDLADTRLLARGLKVGIIEQTETAALKKAGDTRNEVFERKLTHLYTAATYVDSLDSPDTLSSGGRAPPLLCIVEEPVGEDAEKVNVGLVSVCASTGDVVWDHFEGK